MGIRQGMLPVGCTQQGAGGKGKEKGQTWRRMSRMEWARNACCWESSAKNTPALLYNVSPVLRVKEVVWVEEEGKSI